MENLYADIAGRTGGNIYLGVVGPVRTGKSTLIKRIMEQLVIPNIPDPYRAQRARDELPQSGSGRTIMTSEPKFIPEEAVEIQTRDTQLRVRLIDTVGYMIPGATGATEEGVPRMVTTPWYDHEIPMTEAAELGTKKVMQEHASIGLVVTTDGSITDIPRQDYSEAERKAIRDMQATGKPFLVIINSRQPQSQTARQLQEQLRQEFGLEAVVADCQALTQQDLDEILEKLLYAFPLTQLRVFLPRWMDALEWEHPIKSALCAALQQRAGEIRSLGAAADTLGKLQELEDVLDMQIRHVDLATGCVSCHIRFPEALFYRILSDRTGLAIENDAALLSTLTELSKIKAEYDGISDALQAVNATGYGIVTPTAADMTLRQPEILKKNGAYGLRLKASAPSIHMIRVDIDTEIQPMVGDEQRSRELAELLCSQGDDQLRQSHIFGRSVYDLLQDGLNAKLTRTPEDVKGKFQSTLTRIVNEGANGLICLIL